MEKSMYQSMYETETYHWYFKAKYEIVLSLLKKYGLDKNNRSNIIDFGCGCGRMLQFLSEYGTTEGVDFSDKAILYCKKNFDGALAKADLETYSSDKKYDYGVALDVLEHTRNDLRTLINIRNAISQNGICVFTVPAFMCLWSEHDKNCMHQRRYRKKQLIDQVSASGFKVEFCSYYNFWFFPIVFLLRKIENLFRVNNSGSRIEYGFKDGLINDILYKIFVSEKTRLCKNRTFLFGVSLICIARNIDGKEGFI